MSKKSKIAGKATYHEWLMNRAKLPFLVASIDSNLSRDMINASLKPAKDIQQNVDIF